MEQYPNPYYQYAPNEPSDLSLVEQTNPEEVVEKIEMTLRGKTFDKQKGEWILKQGAKPIINEFGVNSIMTDARPFINQISTLSNATIDQVSKITLLLADTLRLKIENNWKEFEIDKSNLSTVKNAVTIPSFMTGLRALGEGERKFLKTSVRAIESYVTQGRPQQSSTSEKLKFWR